jgi:hypothetical protein
LYPEICIFRQTEFRPKEDIQMRKLTLGPFITTAYVSAPSFAELVALGLQLEWANEYAASKIPLFRRCLRNASGPVRLEHLLFARNELPLDLECPEHQVVETTGGTFLPMEALMSALYTLYVVNRSILQVLAELASVVPLHCPIRHPIMRHGLLVPQAEAAGFRLNTVIREGSRVYAGIGWQPAGHSNRFHAGVCMFKPNHNGEMDDGTWQKAGVIGVASLLARELYDRISGTPLDCFTPTGLAILQL